MCTFNRPVMNRRNCNFFNLENTLALKGGGGVLCSRHTHTQSYALHNGRRLFTVRVLRQLFRMRGTAFLYVTWKWKTFPCKSQSWRTSNGGTHSASLPSRPSTRAECSDSLQFAQTCMRTGPTNRRWEKRESPDSRRCKRTFEMGRASFTLQRRPLCWNVKAARLCCFSRFLPDEHVLSLPPFGVYLPPARLDSTRWVHLDESQFARWVVAKVHIIDPDELPCRNLYFSMFHS